MPQLPWLDGYSGQTTRELLALEGKFRTDSIIVAFEDALLIAGGKLDREGESALSAEERMILAIEALEREVNNGGYKQFFQNSSREFAPIILEALERIGCKQTVEITRRAIDALHLPIVTVESIEAALADETYDEEELDRCDQSYLATREDLAGKLFAFIKAHPDTITL